MSTPKAADDCLISCLVCSIAAEVWFTVSAKFAFALPSVIDRYFSFRTSYFVLITFAVAETPSLENSTETLSQRFTRSKSAYCAYSGECHKCTNETVMLTAGTSKPLVSTHASTTSRNCSSVISFAPLKRSEKSLIHTRLRAYAAACGDQIIFSGKDTTTSSGCSAAFSAACGVYFAYG